jgi:2-amino-4-hydroxy-6-hydroxymethyldihydropteridine diphosphokinase
MNRIFVVLGSNINKEKNLPLAVRFLSKLCHVAAVSPVYETVPVGPSDQPNFFNAAVLVETEIGPIEFKEVVLSKIERRLQRQRTADKNAPRTIDADIVLFNDEVLDYGRPGSRQRHIPDPDLLEFAHVAVPVAQLAPNMPHPETGEPLATIAGRLMTVATQNSGPPLWLRPDILLRPRG